VPGRSEKGRVGGSRQMLSATAAEWMSRPDLGVEQPQSTEPF